MNEKAPKVANLIVYKDTDKKMSGQEQMDLPSAQKILLAVVKTHEKTYEDEASLERVGDFSVQQAKKAFEVIAVDLMKNPQKESRWYKHRNKITTQGNADLNLYYNYENPNPNQPESLQLDLHTDKGHELIDCQFELREGKSRTSLLWSESMGYADYRELKAENVRDLKEDFTLDKYQHIWRGIRWMAANLLVWNDEKFIMPEELDTNGTSSASRLLPEPKQA